MAVGLHVWIWGHLHVYQLLSLGGNPRPRGVASHLSRVLPRVLVHLLPVHVRGRLLRDVSLCALHLRTDQTRLETFLSNLNSTSVPSPSDI